VQESVNEMFGHFIGDRHFGYYLIQLTIQKWFKIALPL